MARTYQTRQLPARQRARKALLFASLLLFPITLYYFSPALILAAASEGVVNGCLLVFGLLFLSSLFVGRLWCGWACPAGALQEYATPIHGKPTSRKLNVGKWVIWVPWMVLIVLLAVQAGGYQRVDPFYQLEGGLTLAIPTSPEAPPWYLIYYIIIGLFAGLAVAIGRRAGCHAICWMAPFMILGRKLRNLARWPSLCLSAEPAACTHCETCNRNCPMSLDVHEMVQRGDMEHSECVLCASCADGCPKGVIRLGFGGGGKVEGEARTSGSTR